MVNGSLVWKGILHIEVSKSFLIISLSFHVRTATRLPHRPSLFCFCCPLLRFEGLSFPVPFILRWFSFQFDSDSLLSSIFYVLDSPNCYGRMHINIQYLILLSLTLPDADPFAPALNLLVAGSSNQHSKIAQISLRTELAGHTLDSHSIFDSTG